MKTVNRKNFNIVTLLTEVLFETLAFRLHKEGIAQALCQVQLSLVREEAANNKYSQIKAPLNGISEKKNTTASKPF